MALAHGSKNCNHAPNNSNLGLGRGFLSGVSNKSPNTINQLELADSTVYSQKLFYTLPF